MIIETVSNPIWADKDHTYFNVDVKFEEFDSVIPFTANPLDTEEHGLLIYSEGLKGTYGTILSYVPPSIEEQRESYPHLTSRQFWLTALSIGVTKAQILAATTDPQIEVVVNETTSFVRTDPAVSDLAGIMGVTDVELDSLWLWAAGV